MPSRVIYGFGFQTVAIKPAIIDSAETAIVYIISTINDFDV